MEATDQLQLQAKILEAIQAIVQAEGGDVIVREVRVVPGKDFFGLSNGDTLLLENGDVAVRIAVGRPADAVVDTILHETAHVLLGREHIDQPDHGARFRQLHEYLRRKYSRVVSGKVG